MYEITIEVNSFGIKESSGKNIGWVLPALSLLMTGVITLIADAVHGEPIGISGTEQIAFHLYSAVAVSFYTMGVFAMCFLAFAAVAPHLQRFNHLSKKIGAGFGIIGLSSIAMLLCFPSQFSFLLIVVLLFASALHVEYNVLEF